MHIYLIPARPTPYVLGRPNSDMGNTDVGHNSPVCQVLINGPETGEMTGDPANVYNGNGQRL